MDTFYEESAVNQNAKKGERKYKIVNAIYYIFLVITIIFGVWTISAFPLRPGAGANEEVMEGYALQQTLFAMVLFVFCMALSFTILFHLTRRRINVSYDYAFVSGELRITKVFNVNKRKLITKLTQEEILQVGDIDCPAFDRLRSDPQTKEIICTQNTEPTEGKFFMYILAVDNGKKIYVLECREELLLNMMQYLRRDVLDRDYVSQAKKAQRR